MGERSAKLVQFTGKKPEDEKTQLNLSDISLPDHLMRELVSPQSTVSQKSGDILRIFLTVFFFFDIFQPNVTSYITYILPRQRYKLAQVIMSLRQIAIVAVSLDKKTVKIRCKPLLRYIINSADGESNLRRNSLPVRSTLIGLDHPANCA